MRAKTLNEIIEGASVQPIPETSTPVPLPSGCRVPPIDCDQPKTRVLKVGRGLSITLRIGSPKIHSPRENHPIHLCPRFLNMSVADREQCIKQQKLCLNCFAKTHMYTQTYLAVNTHGVFLSTSLIESCHLGIRCSARALIDFGSVAAFISERLLNLFRFPYESIPAKVSGVNQTVAAQPRKRYKFIIGSLVKPQI